MDDEWCMSRPFTSYWILLQSLKEFKHQSMHKELNHLGLGLTKHLRTVGHPNGPLTTARAGASRPNNALPALPTFSSGATNGQRSIVFSSTVPMNLPIAAFLTYRGSMGRMVLSIQPPAKVPTYLESAMTCRQLVPIGARCSASWTPK